ncbi:MAG: NADH:flavin oxidoreductase [Planctomycetales bacterium]|nr:NADH:flavin oxidoreductase [Planctomycetales bacterium]
MSFPRVSTFKTPHQFRSRLDDLKLNLPFDETLETGVDAPLGQPLTSVCGKIGNRWCILPMEGWDGTTDGRPTDLTHRRWENFGRSGAKLIWGGEAVAVRPDGRANPNQLMINTHTVGDLESLRNILEQAHQKHIGSTDDLLIGLQLTHSGRFARPNDKQRLEPQIAYHHPLLDPKYGITNSDALLSDDDIKRLIDDFINACRLAQKAGFRWVDIKHCHGYLGHEFLSGYDRVGEFGGSFENRTRFLREIVAGIRAEAPGLGIGVRLSIFDFVPFHPGATDDRRGVPMPVGDYRFAFGGDGTGLGINLDEPRQFLQLMRSLEIDLMCSTCGSPYYNPHIQRPAMFPPCDGYQPPEDPLTGVYRQIAATAELKHLVPEMLIVGSGYSYLQEWLPHVAQAVVRLRLADSIGLGRMVLSYPDLPADVASGRTLTRKKICRTFSDCTTAPRNGMVSGCYPLDPFYKARPDRDALKLLHEASRMEENEGVSFRATKSKLT